MSYIEIIETLYQLPRRHQSGFEESEIEKFEEEQKLKFPEVLRDYYLTLGKNSQINNSHNRLLSPSQMGFGEDGTLVFYAEYEPNAYWGIKREDLANDNPPVYRTYDVKELKGEWVLDNNNLEDFLLTMSFWNGVLGGLPFIANKSFESPNIYLKPILDQDWKEIVKITEQQLHFYTNDYHEVIATIENKDNHIEWIFVGSAMESKFLEMLESLPLDWDYRSDKE